MATGNVYEVIYTKWFKKQLAKMPHTLQQAVDNAIDESGMIPSTTLTPNI